MEADEVLFELHEERPNSIEVADLRTAAGLLALMRLPKVGAERAIRLAEHFGSAEAFNEADPALRSRIAGVTLTADVLFVEDRSPGDAETLCFFDAAYPPSLRGIKGRPAVLWARGTLPSPSTPALAVVGTRKPTSWGTALAASIGAEAARYNVVVVSGLAVGIDIAAHSGALEHGGCTVAVLGSGVDVISPREHTLQAEQIIAAGGCLLSEQPPGTQASPRSLVARNRLQTGLSAATVVVQSDEKSGSMRTAQFAVEQGRDLYCPVPPERERDAPQNAGTTSLLNRGVGAPLTTRNDLTKVLQTLSAPRD